MSSEYGGHLASYASSVDALRSRLQPLLARAHRTSIPATWCSCRATARPACMRAPTSKAAWRRAAEALPPGSRRRRPVVLSASLADAGLLAVPDRVDGPRPDDGHLPGALHPLHGEPRPRGAIRSQGLGVLRRRRDGRAGVDGRADDAGAREASTTSSSSSTATCSASTGRCAATARSSRNWRPPSSAPAGTSSRCCGAAAGIRCSRRTTTAHLRRTMEACVDGEYQNFKAKGGAYTREHFFGKRSGARGDGREHVRRGDLAAEPRRPRCAEGVCGLCRGGRAQGPADGHPRAHRQGLRSRQGCRRPDGRAPAEEDGCRVARRVSARTCASS